MSKEPSNNGPASDVAEGDSKKASPEEINERLAKSLDEAEADKVRKKAENRIELVAAVVLAVATVLTAWSAFQAGKWSGVQSVEFASAGADRTTSSQITTGAGQLTQIDVAIFMNWLNATGAEQQELADFYENRLGERLEPAFNEWVETDPANNPNAPNSPFSLDSYVVPEALEAQELSAEADAHSEAARTANQRGDNYVLTTVLFASVLFFAGVSSKFESLPGKYITLGFGVIVLIAGAVVVASFPIEI